MLDNPLYKEIIAKIEVELKNLWLASPVMDSNGREQVWQMTQMLKKIDSKFQAMVKEAIYEQKLTESMTSGQPESARSET